MYYRVRHVIPVRPGPSPSRVYPGSEEKGLACEASSNPNVSSFVFQNESVEGSCAGSRRKR